MSGGLDNLTHARVRFARACGALHEACCFLAEIARQASTARGHAELMVYERIVLQASERVGRARQGMDEERVFLSAAVDEAASREQEAEDLEP